MKIFLEKDGKKREVSAEKLVGKGGPRFWFKEKTPEPPQQREEKRDDQPVAEEVSDESTTEDDPVTEVQSPRMSEVDPQEIETGQKMSMSEKITSLEKENTELKRALQEIETRLALQENVARQADERYTRLEASMTVIVGHVQRHDTFNE